MKEEQDTTSTIQRRKMIRKKMRDNIREHNTNMSMVSAERRKGSKGTIKDQQEGNTQIKALKEMDRFVITNRERIVERGAEFHQIYENYINNIEGQQKNAPQYLEVKWKEYNYI